MNPTKATLRTQMIALMRQMPALAKSEAGRQVANNLRNFMANTGGLIATFDSLPDEVDTKPIAQMLDALGIKYVSADIKPHHECISFGQGSFSLSSFSVILVPGLAFDKKGYRLGRGKGCYDRLLASFEGLDTRPVTIGIAMDEQIVDNIPIEEHDKAVDMMCTPSMGLVETYASRTTIGPTDPRHR